MPAPPTVFRREITALRDLHDKDLAAFRELLDARFEVVRPGPGPDMGQNRRHHQTVHRRPERLPRRSRTPRHRRTGSSSNSGWKTWTRPGNSPPTRSRQSPRRTAKRGTGSATTSARSCTPNASTSWGRSPTPSPRPAASATSARRNSPPSTPCSRPTPSPWPPRSPRRRKPWPRRTTPTPSPSPSPSPARRRRSRRTPLTAQTGLSSLANQVSDIKDRVVRIESTGVGDRRAARRAAGQHRHRHRRRRHPRRRRQLRACSS